MTKEDLKYLILSNYVVWGKSLVWQTPSIRKLTTVAGQVFESDTKLRVTLEPSISKSVPGHAYLELCSGGHTEFIFQTSMPTHMEALEQLLNTPGVVELISGFNKLAEHTKNVNNRRT